MPFGEPFKLTNNKWWRDRPVDVDDNDLGWPRHLRYWNLRYKHEGPRVLKDWHKHCIRFGSVPDDRTAHGVFRKQWVWRRRVAYLAFRDGTFICKWISWHEYKHMETEDIPCTDSIWTSFKRRILRSLT